MSAVADSRDVFDRTLGSLPEISAALKRLHSVAWNVVDGDLLEICRLRIAMILGCDEELAYRTRGTSDFTLGDLRSWNTNARFGPRERACLAFAEQFVIDVKNLDDLTVDDVREHLGVDGLVNFTSALLVLEQRQRLQLAWKEVFVAEEGR